MTSYEVKKQEAMKRMIEILKSHEIEMEVAACGCCQSPSILFKYKGEEILDCDNGNFDTKKRCQ